jgi:hypothetical protein
MRRSNGLIVGIVVVLVLLIVVAAVVFLLNRDKGQGAVDSTAVPAVTVGKPEPIAQVFNGCPPSGDGGDPALNTLKNRIDEASFWQPLSIATILSYTWPSSIEGRPRSRWSRTEAQAIAEHEGLPVQVEGYLKDAKKMGPESCNCHSIQDVDFHIWITDDPNKGRAQSVVIETSPKVRAVHPNWDLTNMRNLAKRHERVRISGWLMMDPEHPDQIGKTRGTIWEIHPVMQIETRSGSKWTPLDDGTTGVKSVSVEAAPATLFAPTPESTASPPPASSADQQRNQDVQITDVHYDGAKGRNEPDEYVVMTNQGQKPVDITDWVLQDESERNVFKWEGYVMQPGEAIRVYTNEVHPESGGFSFGSGVGVWSNSGDVATLLDTDKELVSRYAYGNRK